MNKFISIISIAAMILVAGACNKQDQPDEGGKVSDLQYLIDGLVRTDEAGNITGYIVGDCLNEANPWEISVPVNNYEEAAAIFRDLLPEDAQVTTSGSSLIWTMTDEEGKPEATAELSEDPGLGAIAAVTIKPVLKTGAAKQVSPSVHFILTSAWPQNASPAEEILERDYYLGATVIVEKNRGFGTGDFVVIRPWTPSECGIMIRLIKYSTNYDCKFASMGALHKVHKALMANYDLLVNGCGKEHGWPTLDYWYESRNTSWGKQGAVNLKTDKENWYYLLTTGKPHVAMVYYFKPKGDEVEIW
jgi:hypothetical protein